MEKTTKIPLFRRCVIQNFPFIEEDFDALTDYGLLCKVVEYLNKVIEQTNATSTQIEELSVAFNSLKDYVDHYFDNLDVQEEINNKLDEMAEQGVLAEIISQYLNSTAIFAFDSVAAMKSAENLVAGSYARTLGYYSANDGGGALYKIRTVTNEDTEDDAFIIAMEDDSLVAEMVIENNKVNIRQLGAKSQITDNKNDIKSYIEKYLARLDLIENRITLYIPSGVWYCSPVTIHRTGGFSIIGDEQFINRVNGGTVICSLNNNQSNIFTIGDTTDMCANFVLKNILFTSADFVRSDNEMRVSTIKSISDCCLKMQGCDFGDTDNLYFQHINGRALTIKSCWEIRFRKLYFRNIDARNSSIVLFGEKIGTSLRPVTATNASMIDNTMFEQTLGDLFKTEYHSEVDNFHFGVINFEDNKIDRADVEYTDFTEDNISAFEESSPVHYAIFNIGGSNYTFDSNVIDSIEIDQFSAFYSTINGVNHCYDRIFAVNGGAGNFSPIINNITCRGIKKNAKLLESKINNLNYRSSFIVNNVYTMTSTYHTLEYDVEHFPYIRQDGRLKASTNTIDYILPSNATPAYMLAINRDGATGRVCSDSNSKTNPKLCAKIESTASTVAFVALKNTLSMVAKIPNGETAKLSFNSTGGWQTVVDLEGTGAFKEYEITLDERFVNGIYTNVSFKTGNTASSCTIDYFIL